MGSRESLKPTHRLSEELLFFNAEDKVAIDNSTDDVEVPCSTATGNEGSSFAHEAQDT